MTLIIQPLFFSTIYTFSLVSPPPTTTRNLVVKGTSPKLSIQGRFTPPVWSISTSLIRLQNFEYMVDSDPCVCFYDGVKKKSGIQSSKIYLITTKIQQVKFTFKVKVKFTLNYGLNNFELWVKQL